jgi:hypothetical protein
MEPVTPYRSPTIHVPVEPPVTPSYPPPSTVETAEANPSVSVVTPTSSPPSESVTVSPTDGANTTSPVTEPEQVASLTPIYDELVEDFKSRGLSTVEDSWWR